VELPRLPLRRCVIFLVSSSPLWAPFPPRPPWLSPSPGTRPRRRFCVVAEGCVRGHRIGAGWPHACPSHAWPGAAQLSGPSTTRAAADPLVLDCWPISSLDIFLKSKHLLDMLQV
jgi:hypothetical protein